LTSRAQSFRQAFTPKLIVVWREGHIGRLWRSDALAGLTVAIVALPLAMALGIASGASPNQGLVTAVIAGFLISLLGGSRVQIGGPTGAFAVIVAGVIAAHGYAGLLVATLLAGIILIAAGYAGVGRLVRFIPMPVITGFTAGIAVIIASSQVGDFFGLTTGALPAEFIPKWAVYFGAISSTNVYALGVGSATLAMILLLRRFTPQLPAFLIALLIASLAVALLQLPVVTVGDRFPSMPTGIPAPHLPSVSFALVQHLWPSAFTIAFLAGLESLLSATVADGMTGYSHRPGQELVAQGIANIGSAIFGGIPATGAIARTATNIRAGARTPLAGMFHAGFLLVFLLAAGKLIAHVPMAALAAILLVVAWGMSEAERFKNLLRMDAGDRALLLLTFGLTVLVDLTIAIGVGVTLASLLFLARMSETAGLLSAELSIDDPAQRAALPRGVEVFRFAGPMFFGVAREMLDAVRRSGRKPQVIILRMDQVPFVDSSGASALEAFARQAQREGTRLILCELRDQPAMFLAKYGPTFMDAQQMGTFQAALDQVSAIT
jgi:SulP family sulfate permease